MTSELDREMQKLKDMGVTVKVSLAPGQAFEADRPFSLIKKAARRAGIHEDPKSHGVGPLDRGQCDGTGICAAPYHWHGCFADADGSRCDEPEAHPKPHDSGSVSP